MHETQMSPETYRLTALIEAIADAGERVAAGIKETTLRQTPEIKDATETAGHWRPATGCARRGILVPAVSLRLSGCVECRVGIQREGAGSISRCGSVKRVCFSDFERVSIRGNTEDKLVSGETSSGPGLDIRNSRTLRARTTSVVKGSVRADCRAPRLKSL